MATSPDRRLYTDLLLYDRSPRELIDRALIDAQIKLPGWTPREGNTEVVLIEALALEVAELVYAINRTPAATLELLLGLLGVTRSAGAPAAGTVTFTAVDGAGYTIPAGTAVRADLADGTYAILTLDADLTIPAASTTATGPVTALEVGADPNGLPAGTDLAIVSSVTFLEAAELATPLAGGADIEGIGEWLDRGVERLGRLTDALVLPEHFTAAALEDVRVFRATTLDNTDPGNAAPYGDDPGHVTVAVMAEGGAALSAGVMAELEAGMEDRSAANLNVHVIAPTITAVNVTATVTRLAGYTTAEVTANVRAALEQYLHADTWPWSGTVRRNELIALIEAAAGVDYLHAGHPTAPAADVPLTGVAPLATLGTLTLTVVAP